MLDSSHSRFPRFAFGLPRARARMVSPVHCVRWSNTKGCELLLMVGLAWLPTACGGDECQRGEVRCSDNAAQYCDYREEGGQLVWTGESCGAAFCKLSNDLASPKPFCAKSVEPDPRCATSAYFEFCDGNQVIGCHQGYVEHTIDCTTGETFGPPYWMSPSAIGACVAQDNAALCALSLEPNPACPTDTVATAERTPFRSVCDGDKALSCFYEYVVLVEATCPAGGTCVPEENVSFCAITSAPDPECPASTDDYAMQPSFCRNGVTEYCNAGWIVRQDTCPSGTQCVDTPHGYSICQAI